MIEYYNTAHKIGLHAKERLVEGDGSKHSANDIILHLLLLGTDNKYHMHMTCDYELKE